MSKFIDITGRKYGKLLVLGLHGIRRNHETYWNCLCDCGKYLIVRKTALGRHTNSCGCIRKEKTKERGMNNRGRGLPYGESAKNKLFDHYKRAAQARKLDFSLSLDEFGVITKKNCFYCGIEPMQRAGDKNANGKYVYNGIDRVDNSIGYTLENCVPCCGKCNQAKMDMSLGEFYKWVSMVYITTIHNQEKGISR